MKIIGKDRLLICGEHISSVTKVPVFRIGQHTVRRRDSCKPYCFESRPSSALA